MKGRHVFTFFLILIILGGLGYIGWSLLWANMNQQPHTGNHTQMPSNQHQTDHNQAQTQQPDYKLSALATSNKDILNDALTTLNQSLEMITIDPYSKTTVPNLSLSDLIVNRTGRGNGNINIYPNGNSTVNVNPSINQTQPDSDPNPVNQNLHVVFDQNKLFQLHQRIFTLAQGIMLIEGLNEDLSNQAEMMENSPPNYTTYVTRYNLAVQNKSKLTNAINLLNQAFTIVNINPYAHPAGFQYNVSNMEQLHQGIYKLSQAMTKLNNLNARLSQQISLASQQIQQYNPALTTPLAHGTGNAWNYNSIFNILLILIVLVIIISVLVAIQRSFKSNAPLNDETGPEEQPE
ncbi:MAG TPA: hypothetical protein VEC37_00020 [Bacillota bacterium]|nr:hypothetical protein [Bacillota bacterium]